MISKKHTKPLICQNCMDIGDYLLSQKYTHSKPTASRVPVLEISHTFVENQNNLAVANLFGTVQRCGKKYFERSRGREGTT